MPSEFAIVPTGAINCDDISDSQLRKLATIASYANESSLCWPSLSTLAEHWGIKKSGASKAVKSLEDSGWLVRIPRRSKEGGTGSNVYYVCRHRGVFPDWVDELKRRGVESHEFNGGLNPMNSTGPLRSLEHTKGTSKTSCGNKQDLPNPTPTQFKEEWNKKMPESLKIHRMGDRRKRKLKSRRKEDTFTENWKKIIEKASNSTFLTEEWSNFSVDWVLKNDTNYAKILEGNYDDDSDSSEIKDKWEDAIEND